MKGRDDGGEVVRITGSLVVARGMSRPRMHDVVVVGERGLLGEIVRLEDDRASIQVYEDTTGMRVGEPAVTSGAPLMVELGPGLLGGIYDGIQRRLDALARGGPFIEVGTRATPLDRERCWPFEPKVRAGERIEGGSVLGIVEESGFRYLALAPPGVEGRAAWVARGELGVEDPVVRLDDGASISMLQRWPMRRARPHRGKLPLERPMLTGQRVFDTFFPVARGGTAVVPGGFGTGKTVVEHLLAKHSRVDVIVYVGCGERGNEMTALLNEFPRLEDPRTGRPLLSRTVLVANTSNMPVAAREASLYTGMTIAEFFRDMGYSVALMADSTSRWAEALREMASRLGEMPAEEGYPPYLAARLASYYERAGVVRCLGPEDREGSVTVVSAVSPPGGDFSEPVTQASLRVGGALWALDSGLAERRHFPAVSWTESYSLYSAALDRWFVNEVAADWPALRQRAMLLLQKEQELQQVVQVVGADALPEEERLSLEAARLLRESFLQQDAFDPVDAFCSAARQHASLSLLLEFVDRCRDALRSGTSLEEVLEDSMWSELRRMRTLPEEAFVRRTQELRQRIAEMRMTLEPR